MRAASERRDSSDSISTQGYDSVTTQDYDSDHTQAYLSSDELQTHNQREYTTVTPVRHDLCRYAYLKTKPNTCGFNLDLDENSSSASSTSSSSSGSTRHENTTRRTPFDPFTELKSLDLNLDYSRETNHSNSSTELQPLQLVVNTPITPFSPLAELLPLQLVMKQERVINPADGRPTGLQGSAKWGDCDGEYTGRCPQSCFCTPD